MVAENFMQSLAALRRREPFIPFEVELINGQRIQVQHPEALAIGGYGLAIYIGAKSETYRFDHESVARLIEPPAPVKSTGNGHP